MFDTALAHYVKLQADCFFFFKSDIKSDISNFYCISGRVISRLIAV